MDLFINTVDPDKFRATNMPWNVMRLNARSNVGILTKLINEKEFENKEEWEEYYYEHGRSKEYLAGVGKRLYDGVKSTVDISLDECIECVRFRVICETWNGVIIRERNVIKKLTELFGDTFTFKKTEGDFDVDYAIDYETFHNAALIVGIQIKPTSYDTSDEDFVRDARKINFFKNLDYEEKFGVGVVTITSEYDGIPTSYKELLKLHKLYDKYSGKM